MNERSVQCAALRYAFAALACIAISIDAAPRELSRAELLRNVVSEHFVPRVAAFARTAPPLVASMEALCKTPDNDTLNDARAHWAKSMLAWESASAINFGPLIARRSVFRIDFSPARPNLIEKALSTAPRALKDLELIGAPAKGFPAIEWLLWTPPEKPELLIDRARCAYALLLAQDIADEAHMLNAQFAAFAATPLPDKVANDAFAGLLNLALNGLGQLGVRKMEQPAERANGRTFPRLASGQTAAAWNTQWLSLRNFLVGDGGSANDNLNALLRSLNLLELSAHMRSAADRVSSTLQATQATPADAIKAAKDIVALRVVLVDEVAAALAIPVQFGENDGD
jgi:predicted lipoprotein